MFDYREQFDHAPDYTGRGLTPISSRGKTGGWNEVNVGTIFEGSIKYVRTGHETKVDSCVELIAADGGAGYNFAIVSTTLAAGQPPNDAACREMAESQTGCSNASFRKPFRGQRVSGARIRKEMSSTL
jgi:hypothetical protein